MNRRSRELPAVLVGVGAAFDFLSGTVRQAPHWMQRAGLEWLYRLVSDPRRLWRRYLFNNPRFLVLIARQIFMARTAAPLHAEIAACCRDQVGMSPEIERRKPTDEHDPFAFGTQFQFGQTNLIGSCLGLIYFYTHSVDSKHGFLKPHVLFGVAQDFA